MKSTLNMGFRLSLICAVAALALANVADVTLAPIAEAEAQAQREAVEAVLPAFAQLAIDTLQTKNDKPAYYYSGLTEKIITGTAFTASSDLGYSGKIEIMMGVDDTGIVSGVRILRHAETPGLGANYAAPELLDEFYKGRAVAGNWKLSKDGGEIDAVTGATVTGRAIADAIASGLQNYQTDKASIQGIVAPATKEGNTP